jgi:hypothetical protein
VKKTDLFWLLYLSEREFIQHHENQRTNASNILGAISAGLIISLGTDILIKEIQLLISMMLIIIGAFGYVFCAKLNTLMKLHADRSYQYLAVLDQEISELEIEKIKVVADKKYKKNFPIFHRIPLNKVWNTFHIAVLLIGIGLLPLAK